jgi:hypothetical protein
MRHTKKMVQSQHHGGQSVEFHSIPLFPLAYAASEQTSLLLKIICLFHVARRKKNKWRRKTKSKERKKKPCQLFFGSV